MGRKRIRAGKYIYFCLALLIIQLFWGCAPVIKPESTKTAPEIKPEGTKTLVREVCRHSGLLDSLSLKGGFDAALRKNQEILSLLPRNSHPDEALFNIGLIYAHNKNPKKDYRKSLGSFRRLIKEFPQSFLVGEAEIWIGVLEDMEKAYQVDIEIEERKKELK